MTLLCPPGCPRCSGEECGVCVREPGKVCPHDAAERHGLRVVEDEPAASRTPTKELPPQVRPATLELTLGEAGGLAALAEWLREAREIVLDAERTGRPVTLTIR